MTRNESNVHLVNKKSNARNTRLPFIITFARSVVNEQTLVKNPVLKVHIINVEIFEFVLAKSERDPYR